MLWPDVSSGAPGGGKKGRGAPAHQVFLISNSVSATEQPCGLGHAVGFF